MFKNQFIVTFFFIIIGSFVTHEVEAGLIGRGTENTIFDLNWLHDVASIPERLASGFVKGLVGIKKFADRLASALSGISSDLGSVIDSISEKHSAIPDGKGETTAGQKPGSNTTSAANSSSTVPADLSTATPFLSTSAP